MSVLPVLLSDLLWVVVAIVITSILAKRFVWQTLWVYALLIAAGVHVVFVALTGFYGLVGSLVWIVAFVVAYISLSKRGNGRW